MRLAVLATLTLAAACTEAPPARAQDGARPFTVTTLADLDAPWAVAVLPDGRMLVTEKDGRMLLLSAAGEVTATLAGTPKVDTADQGALMDVVPAPDFATSRTIYFSFSEAGRGGKGVVLARARLGDGRLDGVERLFQARPYVTGDGHYSGRIAFAPDGRSLFFTNGERQKFTPAQDPKVTLGKVLHLTLDGKPTSGNPLAVKGFAPETWSFGHRNLLGLAFDGGGRLWEIEMGPKGGDELNLIRPGLNYGWPQASNGSHYDGRDIPDHRAGDGFEPPKVWWTPSVSPAGLMIYSGGLFPDWRGDAFLPALSGEALIRVDLDGERAAKGDHWSMGARIRAVAQDREGAILLLEDGGEGSRGRLLRLTPKP